MNGCRRCLGVVFLLLGGAGVILCVAGAVLVWPGARHANQQLTQVFDRIDGLIDKAQHELRFVRTAVAQSRKQLEEYQKEPPPKPDNPGNRGMLQKLLAQSIAEQLAPHSVELRTSLNQMSEASVVLNSFLQDLGHVRLSRDASQDVEALKNLDTVVSKVSTKAQGLLSTFPEDAATKTGDDERVSVVAQSLDDLGELADECTTRVNYAERRSTELRAEADFWTRWGPPVVTVLMIWIALAQIALVLWGLRLFRRDAATF